jgi:putative sterol carrier protein
MLTEASERVTEFTISAPLATWRLVVEGKLDPIQGLMTKKLKLQGNMMKIMRYPKAAKEIISCCALVPTDFGAA